MKRTVKAGRVIITRPFEGLSINTETQVLKMRNRILSFKDKAKATRFCTTHGINIETVDFVLLK